MKTNFRVFLMIAAAVAAIGCNSLDDLQERVDKIDNRVTALEKVADAINGNIAALQAIASGQAINGIEEKDGAYILTLSNGSTITLNQGSVGMGKAPVMSIDKDGYWMVDYQDGNGAVNITDDAGEKIQAVGKNGVTPMFGVTDDGYWTVSYNDGVSYTPVVDTQGNRVKAVAESSGEDSYFAGVEYKDESLVLTLKNGEQYKVPVTGGFLCKINGADGTVTFRLGEKKTFSVEQKGISSTIITKPEGWEAYLTSSVLSIQAPSQVATKAVMADTRTDVSIVAISEAGHIAIAKVHVMVDGSVSVYDPAASVALVEATVNSLKFNVSTENATSWYYMLRPAGEAVPSAADLISSGTKGTDSVVLVEGLKGQTEYVMYVLPCGDASNGPVATYRASTSNYSNLYEAWQDGAELKIGSQTFSKAKNGNANLVTAQNQNIYGAWVNNGNFGIFFIEDGASAVLNSGFNKSVIIVGNKPGTRPTVDVSAQITVAGAETDLVLKNVSLTMDNAANGNIRITNSTEIRRVILEDCYIDLKTPFMQRFYTDVEKNGKLTGLEMIGCDVCVNWRSDCNQFHFVMMQGGGAECGDVTIKNNVFWSKDGKKEFHIFGTNYSGTAKMNNVAVENNTFYNVNNGLCTSGRSKALIMATTVDSYSFSANIAYDSSPVDKTDPNRPHFAWLYTKSMTMDEVKAVMTSVQKSPMNIPEYCSYTTSNGSEWSQGIQNLITWKPGGSSAVDTWVNPFKTENVEAGLFETKSDYSSFGAQRK